MPASRSLAAGEPILDWLHSNLGGTMGEMPQTPPQVPDALQQLGGYLSNSAHNFSRIPGDIGRQVALPYLEQQEKLFTTDWSQKPAVFDPQTGEPGRIPAFASWLTQGLAGGAPGGAGVLSSGLRWGGPPIRAYHGSPHEIKPEPGYPMGRFDPKQIGTGEGAQMYGHGVPYLAEAEPVAENYLKHANWRYGGQDAQAIYDRLYNPALERGLDNEGWSKLNAQRGFWEKVLTGQGPRGIISDARINPDYYGANELAYIQGLDPSGFKRAGGGHMYEVDIHADPNRFLDWDKTLAQQPEMAALLQKKRFPGLDPNITGGELYGRASELWGGDAGTSRVLNKSGVAGTRYLDEQSRAAGKGTSNYAIFDPKLVEIRRRYGFLGPTATAGLLGAGAAADE